MKFRELLEKLDKRLQNQANIDLYDFGSEFGIELDYYCEDVNNRLVGYYLTKWLCTDTWVGSIALFLDNEFIGYSYQPARKSDKTYKFLNKELFDKTREYLLTLVEAQEFEYPNFDINLDEELGEGYILDYNGQHLTNNVRFLPTNEFVEILSWDNSYINPNRDEDLAAIKKKFPNEYSGSIVKIKFENGSIRFVKSDKLEVQYPIIKD